MDSHDEPTCGKGIAANSDLPAKLAKLIAARAEVLERHMKALDLTDANSQKEFDAYAELVRSHRDIGSELARLAQQMAGCHDLPMGRHDLAVMTAPDGQMEAFQQFVDSERELVEHLTRKVEEDETFLK